MKQVGKKHIWIGLILSILILDGFIWLATVRVANAPSAEALRRQQAVTPTIPPSSVNANAIITPSQISLNGPWYHRQSGEETESFLDPDLDITVWDQIDIPQNWYLAGLNYHGMVWFGRHFVVEESYRDQSIQVHFAGVDYQTDVWLNGHYLGQHEGYFESFQFPIQNHLKYGETNTLLVRVNSPYEKIETNWPAQKQIIKGVFNHHPTRPGGLSKADGQAYSTGGIWDDVSLTIGNATTIDDIQIQISWPNQATFPHSAQLEVFIHVIHHADQPQEVTSSITLEPKNFIGKAITLPKQTHLFERGNTVITFTEMISQPQLWQTWERGKPNLYNAQIILKQNNKVIDTQQRSFGFRLVEMDDKGIWHLNKMPIFLRGTHYVSNQWLAKSNRAWLERDLALMRQANLNTIRVHAHVEPPEFYDLADEQGFLVWQDFPLFAGYSDHPTFVDQAQAQFEAMVKQLYNHPSIIAWNVHTQSPWATPSEAASTQNKRLDDRLQRLGSTLDTGRVTFMETPTSQHAPGYGWDNGHWYDFQNPTNDPLLLAYGAQALPNLPMMQHLIPPETGLYQSSNIRARWRFHGFQAKQTFDIAQISEGEGFDTFVANSQAYQATLLQFATEASRRKKYRPTAGIFQYIFVDHWPAISHSVLDYEREKKVGYQALQTAMQPLLASISASRPDSLQKSTLVYTDTATLSLQLWTVNDTLQTYPNALLIWHIETGENLVLEDFRQVSVQPDQAQKWVNLQNLNLAPNTYRFSLKLFDEERNLLSENWLDFIIR